MAASDNTTYMGIALVGGDSQAVQIGSDGQISQTISNQGADNAFHMTIAEGTTATSGYCQGYYVALTMATTAAWSTGSAQLNAFATDLTIKGTLACEAEGMYIYIAGSSTPTLTSANISGAVVYIDDLGAAPLSRAALQLHIADGNVGTQQDAFILCRMEGASSVVTNFIQFAGTATLPDVFLKTNSGAGSKMIVSGTFDATSDIALICNINGASYRIPLHPSSS